MTAPLRFHWMLPKAREVDLTGNQSPKEAAIYRLKSTEPGSVSAQPDMEGWTHFAQAAENAGIDSVLISFSRYEPDPMLVAGALGAVTKRLKFIIAFRTGLVQPPMFVQQLNTLSGLINGRVSINTVAGSSKEEQQGYGDFLSHDDRYSRAKEFLEVCHACWDAAAPVNFAGKHYNLLESNVRTPFVAPDRDRPEIFASGHSPAAVELAVAHSSCYLRVIDTPEKLAPVVQQMNAQGIEVCLRLAIVCRPNREAAIQVIDDILEYASDSQKALNLPNRSDSQMYREAAAAPKDAWLSRSIWAGFKPYYGPVWTTLVGTAEELANAFMAYKRIGVSQFIISGWPEVDELQLFGAEVLPLVRELEQRSAAT